MALNLTRCPNPGPGSGHASRTHGAPPCSATTQSWLCCSVYRRSESGPMGTLVLNLSNCPIPSPGGSADGMSEFGAAVQAAVAAVTPRSLGVAMSIEQVRTLASISRACGTARDEPRSPLPETAGTFREVMSAWLLRLATNRVAYSGGERPPHGPACMTCGGSAQARDQMSLGWLVPH